MGSLVLLLAACQPQTVVVETTFVVEVTAVPPTTPTPIVIETIRELPIEVTRIVVEEVVRPVTPAPLGSEQRPVQLLFAPVAQTAVLQERAQVLASRLTEVSGRQVVVGILDSEAAVIEMLCAAPADTIAVLSAGAYVLAHEQCGAQETAVGVDPNGQTAQYGMIVVRQDSGIETLTDLADKTWAVPATDSLSSTRYFAAQLAAQGITPGAVTVFPGDSSALLAVLNGEVDFATANYIPPIMPFEEREWVYGSDDPELWRDTGILPGRSGIGFIIVNGGPEFGGYRVRDARSGIYDSNRTVFMDTKILSLSEPIPNETIVFGSELPVSLARQATAVLAEVGASEQCAASLCAADVFNWAGMELTTDAAYDPVRFVVQTLNLTAADLPQN
jgi:phosphonate transport system substrate-binding protein